jgi:hypothetical protein
MSKYRIKRFLMAAAILLVCLSRAESRCARANYVVTGAISDCETRLPVPGVQILVFLDDETSSWATTEGTSSSLSSDADGSYRGEFKLNLYSGPGFWRSDRCERRPQAITVVCSAPGYSPRRLKLRGNQIAPLDEKLDATILVPRLYLSRVGKEPCV